MDNINVDKDKIHAMTNEEISEIVKTCFTEDEWEKMPNFHKLSYRVMYTVYMGDPSYSEKYSLKDFLLEKTPLPGKKLPQVPGSPKEYPRPEGLSDDLWHSYSACDDTSSDESDQRRPTLEELWDASDAEHELERSVQREREALAVKNKRQFRRIKRAPPKPKSRKRKASMKPKLKPMGRPKGSKTKKNTQVVPKVLVVRSKNAPITRSQTAVQKAEVQVAIKRARLAAAKKIVQRTTIKSVRQSVAKKIEIQTGKKGVVKQIDTQRETEKTATAQDTDAKRAPQKMKAKDNSENAERKGTVKRVAQKRAASKADTNRATETTEQKGEKARRARAKRKMAVDIDGPPAKRDRGPRRRFIPPPPPPCFYNTPSYGEPTSHLELTIPPLPNPSFRNVLEYSPPFRSCKCTPPNRRKFSPGIIDLTRPSTSVCVSGRLEPPPLWNFQQPYSRIPKLPPPLAPLSNNRSVQAKLSCAGPSMEPSTSADLLPRTDISPVQASLSGNRLQQSSFYYEHQGQHIENSKSVFSPGFHIPRTSAKLSDQPRAASNIDVVETPLDTENVRPTTSVGFNVSGKRNLSVIALPTNNISSTISESNASNINPYLQQSKTFYIYVNKPPTRPTYVKRNVSMKRVLVTSISYIPTTVEANIPRPYLLTYVKSPDNMNMRPFSTTNFNPQNMPVRGSSIENNTTWTIVIKVLSIIPPTLCLPIIVPEEREKRMQPKRVINRKKFIVTPKTPKSQTIVISSKETGTLGSRTLRDITKSVGNKQNIIKERGESLLKVLPGKFQSTESKLAETKSSDTGSSAELTPVAKNTIIKKPVTWGKPKIKIPPHVRPCPTHCPPLIYHTKPLLTTVLKKKPELTTTTASSEAFVGLLPESQKSLSSRTTPLDNIESMPVHATFVHTQLRTYPGPGKKEKQTGSPITIPETEPKNIKAAASFIQTPDTAQVTKLPIPPLAVIKPMVGMHQDIKPSINQPPEKIQECYIQSDSSSGSSDENQEVITIQFPPNFEQAQIQALSSAKPVGLEEVQYITEVAAGKQKALIKKTYKQPQKTFAKNISRPKLISVPRLPQQTKIATTVYTVINQPEMKTIKAKTLQTLSTAIPMTLAQIETTAAETGHISDAFLTKLANSTHLQIETQCTSVTTFYSETEQTDMANCGQLKEISQVEMIKMEEDEVKVVEEVTSEPGGSIQIKDVSAASASITEDQTEIRDEEIETDIEKQALETTTSRRRGRPPLYTSGSIRRISRPILTRAAITQALKRKLGCPDITASSISLALKPDLKSPLHPAKVANFQKLISQVQCNVAKILKDKVLETVEADENKPAAVTSNPVSLIPPPITIQLPVSIPTAIMPTSQVPLLEIKQIQILEVPITENKPVTITTNQASLFMPPVLKSNVIHPITTIRTNQVQKLDIKQLQKLRLATLSSKTFSIAANQVPAIHPPVLKTQLAGQLPDSRPTVTVSTSQIQKLETRQVQRLWPQTTENRPFLITTTKDRKLELRPINKVEPTNAENQPLMITAQGQNLEIQKMETDEDQEIQEYGNMSEMALVPATERKEIKNIKVLTPICTSYSQPQSSFFDGHIFITRSGGTTISLVRPGLYQVTNDVETSNAQPRFYTADEMLAAEVLARDLSMDVSRRIYRGTPFMLPPIATTATITTKATRTIMTVAATSRASLALASTDTTTTTAASASTTTAFGMVAAATFKASTATRTTVALSRIAVENTPEGEETPKFDNNQKGN